MAAVLLPGGLLGTAAADEIELVDLDPIKAPCEHPITFNEPPQGIYDDIIVLDGIRFGERFAGQSLSYDLDFDVLSGSPTNPLTLEAGAADENLIVVSLRVLAGLGPAGLPGQARRGVGCGVL